MCTRLTSAHVKVEPGRGDLVRFLYPECIDQLRELGDEIESNACSAGSDFTAATVDAQHRLQDKLMVRYGLALDPSPTSVNTAKIADILHMIDLWYPQAARVFAGADQVRAELALVANKFWQASYGHKPATEETEWIADSAYADLQVAVDQAKAQEQAGHADVAREILKTALNDTETKGLKLDREVLTAAFGNAGSAPVMVGAPLLEFTGAALRPLVERLEGLVQFHDIGCSLANCAAFTTPTKLSRFWKLLAHLTAGPGSVPDLGDVIAATPGTLLNWKPAFAAVDAAQQRLLDAAAAAEGSDSEPELLALIRQAQARSSSYEATGMFLPAVGDRLYTGVHADQRARVKDHLDFLNGLLGGSRTGVENRLVSLVDGLVRVNDGETALAQLEATKTRLKSEVDDLNRRDAAFGKLIDGHQEGSDSDAFDQMMAEWDQVVGAIDEEAYLRVDDSTELFLTGANASFAGWQGHDVSQVGVQKIVVPASRTITIATDGVWAPSCALRDVRMVDPSDEGVAGQAINPTGVVTGPEGYSIAWSGSSFDASADHGDTTKRIQAGIRVEACSGTPGFGAVGGGFRACAYVDASVALEQGSNWQRGSEGRTSAQFSSGLFLPTTPFEAPAGALVVVEMPPGDTDLAHMRDVHLVHGPHTTIVVPEPADLWIAVNDIHCSSQNDDNELHVRVNTFTTVGDAASALVARMAHAISLVRDRLPDLLDRGEILPSESNQIELQAKLDAIGGPGELQIAVDDYPAPMRDLFYKFLGMEMTQLEAQVRMASIQRELAIAVEEHKAAELAVKNSAISGYLLSLVPEWTARGLHFKELRDITSMYARDVRYYVGPLLRVWYPAVLAGLGNVQALQELTNVDVDTRALSIADSLTTLGTTLAARIASAEVPYPSPQDTAPAFVALRFPNPSVLDPACADSPSARCRRTGQSTTFRWATVAQTQALWNALGQPGDGQTTRRLVFQPSPDDLYQPAAGTHYLSCKKSLPVVRKIGLALTGYSSSQLPPEQRDIEGTVPLTAPMAFADATGVRAFQLENPSWHSLANVPLVYAMNDYAKVLTDFGALVQDVRGVSPFTTFVFDIPESIVAEWNVRGARTIDLILELEAVRAGDTVAVPVCTTAQ